MSQFILDCSVSMAWCFEDETEPYCDAVLGHLGEATAVAPALWPLEVANALLAAERRGRITAAEATRFLEMLQGLPISLVDLTVDQVAGHVIGLGRTYRLSAYDAAYLAVSVRLGLPLATQDRALRAAAEACGVGLFDPERRPN